MDTTTIITILCAVLGSSGLWSLILALVMRNLNKNDLLLGLGHDRIIFLCKSYIERGYLSADEYENLHDYLYEPYEKRGGNGTAKKLMDEVKKLPIK